MRARKWQMFNVFKLTEDRLNEVLERDSSLWGCEDGEVTQREACDCPISGSVEKQSAGLAPK